MAQEEPEFAVRAGAGSHYDYWFTEDGVYRVEVLPTRLALIYSLAPILTLFAVGVVLPSAPEGSALSYAYDLTALVILLFSLLYVPALVAYRRRRTYPYSSLSEVKANSNITVEIHWDTIRNLTLTRRKWVRIEIGKGTLTNIIRAKVNESQAEQMIRVVMPRMGDRFKFRDGMIR